MQVSAALHPGTRVGGRRACCRHTWHPSVCIRNLPCILRIQIHRRAALGGAGAGGGVAEDRDRRPARPAAHSCASRGAGALPGGPAAGHGPGRWQEERSRQDETKRWLLDRGCPLLCSGPIALGGLRASCCMPILARCQCCAAHQRQPLMLRPLALPPRHLQGGNQLTCVPPELAQLTSLQRLRLSMNALEDAGTWVPLLALTQLVVLALDRNRCEGGRRAGRQAVSMWRAGRLGGAGWPWAQHALPDALGAGQHATGRMWGAAQCTHGLENERREHDSPAP